MVGAADRSDLETDHRIARDDTCLHCFHDAILDSSNVLRRQGSRLGPIDELEDLSALQGLDTQNHVTVLATSAAPAD